MTSDSEWETYSEQAPIRSAVDEWETWDVAAPAAAAESESLNLAQAAEDASVLLELFSKTTPRNKEAIGDEHKQMIENAFEGILRIRREFRATTARAPAEQTKVDPECIICYDNIADTVLMPCRHLVLCMVYPPPLSLWRPADSWQTCCDKMGIKERTALGPRTVSCPICRTKILDRVRSSSYVYSR